MTKVFIPLIVFNCYFGVPRSNNSRIPSHIPGLCIPRQFTGLVFTKYLYIQCTLPPDIIITGLVVINCVEEEINRTEVIENIFFHCSCGFAFTLDDAQLQDNAFQSSFICSCCMNVLNHLPAQDFVTTHVHNSGYIFKRNKRWYGFELGLTSVKVCFLQFMY